MKPPRWLEGGEFTPTVAATALSLLAAPIGGLGILTLLFGAWIPAAIFLTAGIVMWFTGKRLLDH